MITGPIGSDLMKSTAISDLVFLRSLLMWATCNTEFLVKEIVLSLFMGMITCFLDSPFVVIWICGLGLGLPLMMLLTLSICLALKARKDSLILSTSEVLAVCLEAWAYNLVDFIWLVVVLLPLKYFEIVLTLLLDFTRSRRGGAGDAFLINMGTGFAISFLLLLGVTLGVNLNDIFILRVLGMKSVPFSLIYQWYEIPNSISHAIKILEIIDFLTVDLFVSNIFWHEI